MRIEKVGKLVASDLILKEILLVPDSSRNLLSISQLCVDNKVYVKFDKQRVIVADRETDEILAEGNAVNGLYQMALDLNKCHRALSTQKSIGGHWHTRLGHLHEKSIQKLVNGGVLPKDTNCKTSLTVILVI